MPKTDPAREALLTALEASGVSIPLWDGILIEETAQSYIISSANY